uniref:Uncharacterized protein n=1 Tax=Corethron hystrix TaxID=216773 RepID=A0A7S1BQT3_9STRA|mmetsp:Transcript_37540/g.87530  ORF Transcript_37540/g.87530 Transcript_37540/m.87530 type:complete len:295 (+) Transcript_37540:118-1002(+)
MIVTKPTANSVTEFSRKWGEMSGDDLKEYEERITKLKLKENKETEPSKNMNRMKGNEETELSKIMDTYQEKAKEPLHYKKLEKTNDLKDKTEEKRHDSSVSSSNSTDVRDQTISTFQLPENIYEYMDESFRCSSVKSNILDLKTENFANCSSWSIFNHEEVKDEVISENKGKGYIKCEKTKLLELEALENSLQEFATELSHDLITSDERSQNLEEALNSIHKDIELIKNNVKQKPCQNYWIEHWIPFKNWVINWNSNKRLNLIDKKLEYLITVADTEKPPTKIPPKTWMSFFKF